MSSSTLLPIFKGPEPVLDWETVEDPVKKMKEHLQTAMTLELYTTPLYLFALYSVDGSDDATRDIKSQSLTAVCEKVGTTRFGNK
jgi:hypothetical protein